MVAVREAENDVPPGRLRDSDREIIVHLTDKVNEMEVSVGTILAEVSANTADVHVMKTQIGMWPDAAQVTRLQQSIEEIKRRYDSQRPKLENLPTLVEQIFGKKELDDLHEKQKDWRKVKVGIFIGVGVALVVSLWESAKSVVSALASLHH